MRGVIEFLDNKYPLKDHPGQAQIRHFLFSTIERHLSLGDVDPCVFQSIVAGRFRRS